MKKSLAKRILSNKSKMVDLFKETIHPAFFEDFNWNSKDEIKDAQELLIKLIKSIDLNDLMETSAYNAQ